MNILLVGGQGAVRDTLINKFYKEGHKLYVLTGSAVKSVKNRKVFEQYDFEYSNDCIKEVLESIIPDVTVFAGAYDTNFDWENARSESTRYSAGLVNILMAVSSLKKGRFIYLSSQEIYNNSFEQNITEDVKGCARQFKSMAILQGENQCIDYKNMMELDTVVMRLDNMYYSPFKKTIGNDVCSRFALEALKTGKIYANDKHYFSLIYINDAVECIHKIACAAKHNDTIYNISSSEVYNEGQIAKMTAEAIGGDLEVVNNTMGDCYRVILSNERFDREFGISIYNKVQDVIQNISIYLKRHRNAFLESEDDTKIVINKLYLRFKGLLHVLLPFIENMICFIPFFMLNNRAVGSQFFDRFDFYLLYVLLFAVIHGQQQATFSALLSVAGYCFRQMYTRSSFEVMIDYNTYVWIAQLFIVGLVVGYLKDRLKNMKKISDDEIMYLKEQLRDIQDINTSNALMKNILTTQIVNQNDSFGKIYDITSSLDKYESGEVLFYAADVVSRLMHTEDVAVYTVANKSYARLFSSTSKKARSLGNSVNYTELTQMYEQLKQKKVYINKTMDQSYPLMAVAIYSEDNMEIIIMLWGIPWDKMTLSQANMLTIVGYLIQNAVIRANRYLEAVERDRYIEGTKILDRASFKELATTYFVARSKNLTECCVLKITFNNGDYAEAGQNILNMLRQSDYIGYAGGNELYVLLANTNDEESQYVIDRFRNAGYESEIWREVVL